ncbi:MAG TPA: hypothetical protein DCF68_09485 [Cyanothece sp. UBA12306]|nr:hypothetical protein [Cyanothece sp. UBA12306]
MSSKDRKSIYEFFGLPSQFGVILLTFGFILVLSPYLSGLDFGIFKIPKLDKNIQEQLKFLGPPIFILFIVFFLPILQDNKPKLDITDIIIKPNQDNYTSVIDFRVINRSDNILTKPRLS